MIDLINGKLISDQLSRDQRDGDHDHLRAEAHHESGENGCSKRGRSECAHGCHDLDAFGRAVGRGVE